MDIDPLPYGYFNVTGYFEGDKVYYFCYDGYKLVGNQNRTCTPNGYWDKQKPECKRMYVCLKYIIISYHDVIRLFTYTCIIFIKNAILIMYLANQIIVCQ